MNLRDQITASNRSLLVTRYGYGFHFVASLSADQVSALCVYLYRKDEANGITWCGWCGQRSHGPCD